MESSRACLEAEDFPFSFKKPIKEEPVTISCRKPFLNQQDRISVSWVTINSIGVFLDLGKPLIPSKVNMSYLSDKVVVDTHNIPLEEPIKSHRIMFLYLFPFFF